MQRTHILIGLAASVGTLTIAAALGFAQPDGLEPPAGPVSDTQPSLTTINDSLQVSGSGSQALTSVQLRDVAAQSQVQVASGRILLQRVHIQDGIVRVADASGVELILEAGRLVFPSGSFFFRSALSYELGVELVGPVTVTGIGGDAADLILLYKELP